MLGVTKSYVKYIILFVTVVPARETKITDRPALFNSYTWKYWHRYIMVTSGDRRGHRELFPNGGGGVVLNGILQK